MQKHGNYRRFSFGRRAEDHRPSTAIMSIPIAKENIEEVARDIVLHMATSGDFKEAMLAELQRNSYCYMTFEKDAVPQES